MAGADDVDANLDIAEKKYPISVFTFFNIEYSDRILANYLLKTTKKVLIFNTVLFSWKQV